MTYQPMTEPELRDYAEALILEHAQDVEYLTIHERVDGHTDRTEIDDTDARAVDKLIRKARVTVHFD